MDTVEPLTMKLRLRQEELTHYSTLHPTDLPSEELVNLHRKIANTFFKLENYNEALLHHKIALDFSLIVYKTRHEHIIRSLEKVAECYNKLGCTEEAEKYHRQAKEISVEPSKEALFNGPGGTSVKQEAADAAAGDEGTASAIADVADAVKLMPIIERLVSTSPKRIYNVEFLRLFAPVVDVLAEVPRRLRDLKNRAPSIHKPLDKTMAARGRALTSKFAFPSPKKLLPDFEASYAEYLENRVINIKEMEDEFGRFMECQKQAKKPIYDSDQRFTFAYQGAYHLVLTIIHASGKALIRDDDHHVVIWTLLHELVGESQRSRSLYYKDILRPIRHRIVKDGQSVLDEENTKKLINDIESFKNDIIDWLETKEGYRCVYSQGKWKFSQK